MKKLFILDTTLQVGEKGPGIGFSIEDKIAVAIQIEKSGVDIIETGIPASSSKDLDPAALYQD